MAEKTVGKLCEELKAVAPNWVNVGGGMLARYVTEVDLDDWLGPDWEKP